MEPRGCLYDEEETYYEDNEGSDYALNPYSCWGDEEDDIDGD